jgi:hypothetical protein
LTGIFGLRFVGTLEGQALLNSIGDAMLSPLWKEQPLLLNQMIAGGLDARIVKVDLGGLVGMEYINKVRLPIPLSVSI